MFFDLLFIVLGVYLVLKGADWLTEGASSLARRMNISEMVIGLTIVAAGTSAPELFVSFVSALKGTPDMAVGNVVGSNIMNTMLIVGCAAVVAPMTISRPTVRKDIPFAIGASLLMLLLCQSGGLSRLAGIVLLAAFAAFMFLSFKTAPSSPSEADNSLSSFSDQGQSVALRTLSPPSSSSKADTPLSSFSDQGQSVALRTLSPLSSIIRLVFGLAMLVVGSNVFVDHASDLALSLGISEGVVGLTVVAGGTSLPELATTVVAARKGQSAMAIGNVIGSNVFNILLILGLTATITPLQIEGITTIDMAVMLLSVALVWLFSRTRYTVERWEGFTLVAAYLAYLIWLIINL